MAAAFFEINYNLGINIGKGSFGSVYLARDTNTDEEIAVKLEKNPAKKPQLQHES